MLKPNISETVIEKENKNYIIIQKADVAVYCKTFNLSYI